MLISSFVKDVQRGILKKKIVLRSIADFVIKMSDEQNGNVSIGEKKVSFEEMDCTLKPDSTDVSETVQDPFCDEKNPRVITFQDVCQAAFMIRGAYLFHPNFQFICQAIK